MAAMAASTDGFLLAEKDLEIRGAGEVFGERQSGWSDLKLGRIPRDEAIVSRRAASPRRSSTPTPTSRATRSSARRSRTSSATRRVPLQVMKAESRMKSRGVRVIAGAHAGAA